MKLRKERGTARARVVLHDRGDALVIAGCSRVTGWKSARAMARAEWVVEEGWGGKVLGRLLEQTQVGERGSINKFIHLERRKGVLRVAEGLGVLEHLGPLHRLGADKESARTRSTPNRQAKTNRR